MPDFIPKTYGPGDTFTGADETEVERELEEQENKDIAQDAAIAALQKYTHTQSSASSSWSITHTLGRKPSSVAIWISDELVYADITAPNTTTVSITFPSPVSGRAELT